MLQEYSRYRILQEFFDFPTKNFQIRELSRIAKIAQLSVANHTKALIKKGLLVREKRGIYPSIKANRDNALFRLYKKLDLVCRIFQTGLLGSVYDSCMPDSIILFGSASKGEDVENSDIDLFVQAPEKKLNLEKYEKLLNRKITLFFEENFSRLPDELKNNILNGIILKGYVKVF
ncbi:MAG: nucleotidyltransferase domain-containing protein [archaeon]